MEFFRPKSDTAKPLGITDEQRFNAAEPGFDDRPGHILTSADDQLRPHPSYVRHHLAVSAERLSALVAMGDLAFRDPLLITRERVIVDGYARWDVARKQGRSTLRCIEYELSEADALHWLLQRHRRSAQLNDYCRILLALDFETSLKEKARANQQVGGREKGSSKLTSACTFSKKLMNAWGSYPDLYMYCSPR